MMDINPRRHLQNGANGQGVGGWVRGYSLDGRVGMGKIEGGWEE